MHACIDNKYRIACNFRGVKISFILKKEIFVSKNVVFRAAVEGGGARLGFSWVKNFVEVSSLTKITKFLPHENYTLYGIQLQLVQMYNVLQTPLELVYCVCSFQYRRKMVEIQESG